MVAGEGVEPSTQGYESCKLPLLYPAILWSGWKDLNIQPRSPKLRRLPLNHTQILELTVGLEPTTCRLQVSYTTNCVTLAYW